MVSFTDHTVILFFLTRSPRKLKLEKIIGTLIILFYVNTSSPQLQIICPFNEKHTHEKKIFSKWLVRIHQLLF